MGKKGIKIEDLARELGLTARQLMERCRAEGLAVQNSITKLRADQERRVRSWFVRDAVDADRQASAPAESSPSVRDDNLGRCEPKSRSNLVDGG
ncbi:MAG TPA: hypothetical protein PKK06_09490 [Phycisphaerae bacterium]|nr:hypothetical protein [Phycisphaerae bacterium]